MGLELGIVGIEGYGGGYMVGGGVNDGIKRGEVREGIECDVSGGWDDLGKVGLGIWGRVCMGGGGELVEGEGWVV